MKSLLKKWSILPVALIITAFYSNAQSPVARSNRQYFFVKVSDGLLKSREQAVQESMLQRGFIAVKADASSSSLQITAEKGTKIEDVKAALIPLKLYIVSYKEEYGIESHIFPKQ